MTESYILYLDTLLPAEAVLETMFMPKHIAPVEGTTMLYARGSVYLAHAQPLPEAMQERYQVQLNFTPTLSIRYFPDGVSSFKTALHLLAECVMRWIHQSGDTLLLTTSKNALVLRWQHNKIQINSHHAFWGQERLKYLDLPYDDEEGIQDDDACDRSQ
ncbi:MAG: hypothetical protein ACFE0Q_06105 [Anaerolineae bacterium]